MLARKSAPSPKDLGDDRLAADFFRDVILAQVVLLQEEPENLLGRGGINREYSFFS